VDHPDLAVKRRFPLSISVGNSAGHKPFTDFAAVRELKAKNRFSS
jgi:hypothetical protein